jgi:hypothetical protein
MHLISTFVRSSQPIVVVHLDDDGARLAKHSAVGNLPYMHRSPAV